MSGASPARRGTGQEGKATAVGDATTRFPEPVAQVLRAAGWFEGRDDPGTADALIAQVLAAGRAGGFEFEVPAAAHRALREFGGLEVTAAATGLEFPGHDFSIDPVIVTRRFEVYAELDRIIGGRSFPFGVDHVEHTGFALGPDGRVYLLHYTGFYIVGDTVDEALVKLVGPSGPFTDIFDVFEEPAE
jgi:hypothetical protein